MKNLKNVPGATWVRTAVMLFALINQGLTMTGHSVLPFSEQELNEFLTYTITILSTIWGFWKNNSFTTHAREADKYGQELKKENGGNE